MSNYEPPAPPPPPSGGTPPPPPQPPAGPGEPQPYSAGDAFTYGWTKFQANAGQMILAALAIFVGALIIFGVGFFLIFGVFAGETECIERDSAYGYCTEYGTSGLGFFGTMVLTSLISAVFFIYAQVVAAGMIRAALNVTDGQPFRTADVFKFDNIGPVVITSVLVGAGVAVGSILCYLPGLVFGFFASYSLYFLIDQKLDPIAAIKASFSFVNKNLGATIIWYLISLVVGAVGYLLCGIGLLVAVPIIIVGTAYTYRKLNGQPVAA